MKTYYCTLLSNLLFINISISQTTWTGSVDQNWHNAANWSNGLPAPGNDAFIPDVVNDPVISESTDINFELAIEGFLTINSTTHINQQLTIMESAVVLINDSLTCSNNLLNFGLIDFGTHYNQLLITNSGALHNSGLISTSHLLAGRVINEGYIINNAEGVIYTFHIDGTGLHNFGLLVNEGVILGIEFNNDGEFVNEGILEINHLFNCVNIQNNGTILLHGTLWSTCSIMDDPYFLNDFCGYILKEDDPFSVIATIDVNNGVIVDLEDETVILENNGIYTSTFIPDIPIITCFDTVAYLDSDGLFSLTEEMLYEYFDCGDTIVLMSDPNLDCNDLNEQVEIQIGYLVSGEPTYLCSAQVLVLDTTPPFIDPLSMVFGQVLCDDPLPVHPSIIAEDNCQGNLTIIEEILSYQEQPCEGYFITYTWEVMDDQGNVAFASSDLEVLQDDLGPDLICIDTIEVLVGMQPVVLSGEDILISAEDNCTEVTVPSQSFSFDQNDVGTHSIVISAIDECGNTSTCTTLVIVQTGIDMIPPMLVCTDTAMAFTDSNCLGIFIPTVSATDNSGEVEIMLLDSTVYHPDNLYQPGTYLFTYLASDASGNTDTCFTTLIVLDTTPPYLIDSLGIFYFIPPGGGCEFNVVLIPPLAADNCDLNELIFSYEFFPSLESLSPGDTFTIIYSTEDNSGNAVSFVATRVVPLDLFLGVTIECPGDVELQQTTFCPVGLYWDEPILTNACNLLNYSSTYSSGDTLLPGTYLASYEYTDILDTVHSCSFNIVVTEQDTLFESATVCESGVILLPWNGFPVTDPGLYCYDDSICMTTQCLDVMLIPTITTEYDTMICPNGIVTPGTYLYVLTSALGCDSIVIVHVFSCTAVEDLALESAIHLYPNPATHTISIACEGHVCAGSRFELLDVNGNVIKQGVINDEKTEIPVSSSIAGIVMIKITNGRHSIVEKVIVLPD